MYSDRRSLWLLSPLAGIWLCLILFSFPVLAQSPEPNVDPPPPEIVQANTTPAQVSAGDDEKDPVPSQAKSSQVVINEIAWSGTAAAEDDEWIELYNAGDVAIDLTNWVLAAIDGRPSISLTGVIPAYGFFLMEGCNDNTLSDIPADMIYTGQLGDAGENLQLIDPTGAVIDTANAGSQAWPAGTGSPDYLSMERISPRLPDTPDNWTNNKPCIRNGTGADGNAINGTPRQRNSSNYPVLPGDIVINEVAWAGSRAAAEDEWIELANTTDREIKLAGIHLLAADGQLNITLSGTIGARSYFLIERDHDDVVSDIPADLVHSFGAGLDDGGESLSLITGTLTIDTANAAGSGWAAGQAIPTFLTMERLGPDARDIYENWDNNDGIHHNGLDRNGNPVYGTPAAANSTLMAAPLLVSEFLPDGITPDTEGDEFVELCNAYPVTVTLTGFKVGDAQKAGAEEGMYQLPAGYRLQPGSCLVIAKNASQFFDRFGFLPDFELLMAEEGLPDTPQVPELESYTAWADGRWNLSNSGDEVIVLGRSDQQVDGVAYGNGGYAEAGVAVLSIGIDQPDSLHRMWPWDADIMPADFVAGEPDPGQPKQLPIPPSQPAPVARLTGGMNAYWGVVGLHSAFSDGGNPPVWEYAAARSAGMHFAALSDPDDSLSGLLWAYTKQQAVTDTVPAEFVALSGFEYPADAGSIFVWASEKMVSHTQPAYDELAEFWSWLADQPEAMAGFSNWLQTDWLEIVPDNLPAMGLWQIILQGADVDPERKMETDWVRALARGWQVGPMLLSPVADEGQPGDNKGRMGIVAPDLNREQLLAALQARRVFATQDDRLALTLRCGERWMGSQMEPEQEVEFVVESVDLDLESEAITLTLFNRNLPLTSRTFEASSARWVVSAPARPGHFFWVYALQTDGDAAWTAPIWITGSPQTESLVFNEVLPSPRDVDWDQDGICDRGDEWAELYNPGPEHVGLGGWSLLDASGSVYVVPLGEVVPANGFHPLYRSQTELALNDQRESLVLLDLGGIEISRYGYEHGPGYDISTCSLPDGQDQWQRYCLPTPGQANQALPEPRASLVSIFDAQRLAKGSWIRVRGRVTVPPGLFSERVMYLQDETGGIRIYLPQDHDSWFDLGERLEISGHTGPYHDEQQIRVAKRQDVHHIADGDPPPPLPVAGGQIGEMYEGLLVQVTGRIDPGGTGTSFYMNDGSGPVRVYIDPDTNIRRPDDELQARVVGVVSQYYRSQTPDDPGYRIMPRYTFDLVVEEAPPALLFPTRLPETGRR